MLLDQPNTLDSYSVELISSVIIELSRLRGALAYYADPQNTVRDCMVPGQGCANTDMCKLAIDTLKEFET